MICQALQHLSQPSLRDTQTMYLLARERKYKVPLERWKGRQARGTAHAHCKAQTSPPHHPSTRGAHLLAQGHKNLPQPGK